MGLLLRGGMLVDPLEKRVAQTDVLIEDGRIAAIGGKLSATGHEVRDVSDLLVAPGLIDVHVHLREPGFAHKETIESGARAAAAGGFTQVCCMPNTRPVTDQPEIVRWVREEAARFGHATVHPIAAVTEGSRGERLTDFAALREAGAVAFSDDGRGVQSAAVMREALIAAARLGVPVAVHAEDESLSAGGSVHAGDVARELGLQGILQEAETAMIARDIVLAAATGAHVHICHVSPAAAVEAIRAGKRLGVRVTAEVAPHHLLLNEELLRTHGGHAKVNPPLRAESDRLACVRGLLDGALDIIATDHAPHTEEEKARPVAEASFGFSGLEISLPTMFTAFVHSGVWPIYELIARMSFLPARHFGLAGGRVAVGARADITVIDPFTERVVQPDAFFSKGKVTPFAGRPLYGWPVLTVHAGRIVHDAL